MLLPEADSNDRQYSRFFSEPEEHHCTRCGLAVDAPGLCEVCEGEDEVKTSGKDKMMKCHCGEPMYYSDSDTTFTCVICGNEVKASGKQVQCFKCDGKKTMKITHRNRPDETVWCDDCDGSGYRPATNGGMKLIQINETFAPLDPVEQEFRELDDMYGEHTLEEPLDEYGRSIGAGGPGPNVKK